MKKIKSTIYAGSVILALLNCSISGRVLAQGQDTGAISGYVSDNYGNPLAGISVSAGELGGFFKDATTQEDGNYIIQGLIVGYYGVSVNNELGYINERYDNVYAWDEATLIKVNANQTVTGIDFILEKGGSIAGRVFASDGITPISDIGVAVEFYDTGVPIAGGAPTQQDGSYAIATGLPSGRYSVGADGANWVGEWYDNIFDCDNTTPVVVNAPDTTFGIDFILQKGGAIAGHVYEADGVTPIEGIDVGAIPPWACATGLGIKGDRSKADGSYKCVGLGTGNHYVHATGDPSEFHDAAVRDVWVNAPDTTFGVDILLSRVSKQSISNQFIEISVTDKMPPSNLTVGNTGGLPETLTDDNKDLLFGHPSPYTSFTSIWVDGGVGKYGNEFGEMTTGSYVSEDGKSITRVWTIQNIDITQKITLVKSTWSLNQYEDTAEIRYTIVNQDNTSHEVGVRIMLDTMLGDNDGAPIMIPYSEYSDYEREFLKDIPPGIPPWWTAIEGDPLNVIFSAQGTMTEGEATVPDRFVTAAWTEIFETEWEYEVSSDRKVIFDSAVAMWWYPRVVAIGDTLEIVTYYGLGEGSPDLSPPYTAEHNPQKGATEVPIQSNITLHIKDDHKGVDKTSIVMKVNAQQVTPTITGELRDYTISYDPVEDFHYNEEVTVSIDAKDLAWVPNAMETEVYTILMVSDTIPPYTTGHNPAKGAVQVPTGSDIIVHVKDDESGVDISSLEMEVEGQLVTPQITGTISDYTLTYHPSQPLMYSDTIDVVIRAQDLSQPANIMPDDRYQFYTVIDQSPPFITDHNPRHGEGNVALNTNITFRLRDDLSGVDTSSIKLTVDGVQVTPEVSGRLLNYLVCYNPPQDFNDNQTVRVEVAATDRANPPNVMPVEVYTFTTVKDTIPPFTLDHFPARERTNVLLNTKIQVRIRDDLMGVDFSSMVMRVNDELVTPTITGDKQAYLLNYQPSGLNYNDTVSVQLDAKDLATPPNVMKTDSYFFTTVKDISPPFTTDHIPPKEATFVSPDVNIALHVRDNLAGVDERSIVMKVNGSIVTPTISGSSLDYEVIYAPPTAFDNNEVVTVSVDGRDLATPANVMATDIYTFSTLRDTLPPFTTEHNPAKGAENVALDADIVMHLRDDLSGVDESSIAMTVNGEQVSPEVNGNSMDYELRYRPPQEWSYNETVQVTISAQDLSTPANIMEQEEYTFSTIHLLPDLMVTDLRSEGQLEVGKAGRVLAKIRNEGLVVEQAFHVLFRADGSTVKDTVVNGLCSEEEISIPALIVFSKGGTHEIEVVVDSRDEISELAESNNSQKLVIEILGGPSGQLVVRPNPFTPNGDGYNDEVVFQVAGIGLESPVVKIFDRRGIEVKEIKSSTAWLSWDGRNEKGQELEPGVYIYLLMDGDKKINSGTVVLAR